MGWLRRIFHRFNRGDPRAHPWISPKFLVLYAALGVLGATIGVWAANKGAEPSQGAGETAEGQGLERDYVGFPNLADALERAGLEPGCDLPCLLQRAEQDWAARHPGAVVVSRIPVADPATQAQIGTWILYQEASP